MSAQNERGGRIACCGALSAVAIWPISGEGNNNAMLTRAAARSRPFLSRTLGEPYAGHRDGQGKATRPRSLLPSWTPAGLLRCHLRSAAASLCAERTPAMHLQVVRSERPPTPGLYRTWD